MSSFFTIQHLSKSFGGVKAVQNLSFTVNKGEIFSIIGPNGAGKSTVFNCINGLYKPTGGSISFQGEALIGKRPDQISRLGIARTFQNLELFAHMSTMDNILLGRHLHMKSSLFAIAARCHPRMGPSKEEIAHRGRVEEIIDFLDLQAARNTFVSALPYGQQKIVELGRALATEPQLLLLDEPAAGLNQEEREELVFWIKDIRDQFGITVILIEHNMQLVTQISDRLLALNFGQKLVEGSVEEVINHPEVIRAYLG
ncbi:MAG: ABC transporter ATP-binding protein [Bacteroidota bacterium]